MGTTAAFVGHSRKRRPVAANAKSSTSVTPSRLVIDLSDGVLEKQDLGTTLAFVGHLKDSRAVLKKAYCPTVFTFAMPVTFRR